MNQQMKILGLSLLAASMMVACTKKDDSKSNDDAKVTDAKKNVSLDSSLKNETTSEVIQISEGKYAVLPPAVPMKGINVANNPVKATCKKISALEQEIKAMDSEKGRVVEVAKEDNSGEAAVDDINSEIEAKSAQLEALLSSTAPQSTTYDKEALYANLEALKAANPEASFEAAEPRTAELTLENENRKASASQTVDLSKAKLVGSFASADREVKMTLDVSYNVLCSYRKVTDGKEKLMMTLK